MAFLILAPVFIMLLASAGIVLLQWRSRRFGYAWIIATTATLLSWGVMLYLRLRLPETLVLAKWQPATLFAAQPVLAIDRPSWPYATALVTLILAMILTDSARTHLGSVSAINWAGSLALGAVGLLAVLAGNPFTLMVAWTAIDLVELMVLLGGEETISLSRRVVIAFAARLLGTMALLAAIIISPTNGESFDLSGSSSVAIFFFLLAAGLRLGVLPLHLPFTQEPRLRRGMGTILRLAPVASALALLARLPDNAIPERWIVPLAALVSLAAFYSAAKWLSAENEMTGRPYWLVGMGALALMSVVNGKPAASLAWGLALLLPGGLLFLYSARRRSFLFLTALGLWGMLGLPFSPAATGWQGLSPGSLSFWGVLIWLALILLILGYIRHALRAGDPTDSIEKWALFVYPLGLFGLIFIDIVIGIWGWPGSRSVGIWWMGAVTVSIVALVLFVYRFYPAVRKLINPPETSGLPQFIRAALGFLGNVFRLDWLYRFIWFVYETLGKILTIFSAILEGDGGVLWALLLLVLLVSLIGRGGF